MQIIQLVIHQNDEAGYKRWTNLVTSGTSENRVPKKQNCEAARKAIGHDEDVISITGCYSTHKTTFKKAKSRAKKLGASVAVGTADL
jgi:DNA polymerase III alpha subunit